MKTPVILSIAAVAAILGAAPSLRAYDDPSSLARISSGVTSSMTANSGTGSRSSFVMIKNRARTFSGAANASGTRYFAVTDADIRGKSPQEVIQRLSPSAITNGEAIRRLEILVELREPLTIRGEPGTPVNVGTASTESSTLRHLDVRSSILTQGLTVISK